MQTKCPKIIFYNSKIIEVAHWKTQLYCEAFGLVSKIRVFQPKANFIELNIPMGPNNL